VLCDADIRVRDGDRCARCGKNGPLHVHHRRLRSAGGDERESGCNRVTLCAGCHRWAHLHPAEALGEGWLVGRYQDPSEVPVQHYLWPAGPVLLEPGGGITIHIPDGTE